MTLSPQVKTKPRLTIDLENTLVGYHGNCSDGMGAAWAARHFGVPEANIIECNYGDPLAQAFRDHTGPIVFVDYRPKLDDLHDLTTMPNRRVFVVDHHKAAFEAFTSEMVRGAGWGGTLTGPSPTPLLPTPAPGSDDGFGPSVNGLRFVYIFDNDHSGARLAWDFFQGCSQYIQDRPLLIDLIEDYDLWRKKLDLTEDVALILQSRPLSFHSLDRIQRNIDDGHADFLHTTGMAYREMRAGLIEKAVANIGFTDLGGAVPGAKFPVVNASVFKNEISEALLNRGYEVAVVWSFIPNNGGQCLYSLRSKDVDVAAIAQKFGGNGHQRAAGFATTSPIPVLPEVL